MLNPARRKRSIVAASRLPFGIPSFSFTPLPSPLGPIHRPRIISLLGVFHPFAVLERPVKATVIAVVAYARTHRLRLHQQRVAIAVRRYRFEIQIMPGAPAFCPKLLPRAAEKCHVPRPERHL